MQKYQVLDPSLNLSKEALEIKSLMRIPDEPCIYIGDFKVHEITLRHAVEFMDSIQAFYREWADNPDLVHLPKKQLFYTQDLSGDFRVMPCTIDAGKRIKSVKIIGTNEENVHVKDKICVGKSLLIDKHDNFVYAIMDVCSLSSFRTAAISVLAFSAAADSTDTETGIVGLGRIGFYSAYILHVWLGIKTFYCHDKNPDAKRSFSRLAEIYMPSVQLNFVDSEQVIGRSNALFIATDSNEPILTDENSHHLGFISSVGADADNLSELNESILSNGHQIISDSLHSLTLGDMKTWKSKGLISDNDVLELKDIINQQPINGKKTIFISTGIAVQDALFGQYIVDKIEDSGETLRSA